MIQRDKFARMVRYVQRARDLLDSLRDLFTNEEYAEVSHLIDHNETPDAICILAWIIVEKDRRISPATYSTILELTGDLVAKEDMPENLEAHVVTGGKTDSPADKIS